MWRLSLEMVNKSKLELIVKVVVEILSIGWLYFFVRLFNFLEFVNEFFFL